VEAAFRAAAGDGGGKRAERLLDTASAIVERIDHPHAHGLTVLAHGIRTFLDGRWKESLDKVEEAARIFRERCPGTVWEVNAADDFALWCLYYLGHFERMAARVPSLIVEARERGDLFASTARRTISFTLLMLAKDEPERALEEVESAMETWYPHGFQIQDYYALYARQQIAIYQGEGETAYRTINESWEELQRSLIPRVKLVHVAALDVRARSALCAAVQGAQPDRRAALLREAARDARRLVRAKMQWGVGLGLQAAAQVAALRDQNQKSAALLSRSAQIFDEATMPLHAAASRWRRGEVVGGGEGAAAIEAARARLTESRVANPARFVYMLTPGFPLRPTP
jgi:hypothetical protein